MTRKGISFVTCSCVSIHACSSFPVFCCLCVPPFPACLSTWLQIWSLVLSSGVLLSLISSSVCGVGYLSPVFSPVGVGLCCCTWLFCLCFWSSHLKTTSDWMIKTCFGTMVDFPLTSSVIWILKQNHLRISVLESYWSKYVFVK